MARPHRWFIAGCLGEGALLGVAAFLGWLLGQSVFATFRWQWLDGLLGLMGVLPMALVFWWMLRSPWRPLVEIRSFLDQVLPPVLGQWHLLQLATISGIAGVAEECLFRAVIQGGLTHYWPPWAALTAASVLFGLCHAVTRTYAVLAALIGLYLGVLWMWTGNLLAPIIAHAVYDFAALTYLLRVRRPAI